MTYFLKPYEVTIAVTEIRVFYWLGWSVYLLVDELQNAGQHDALIYVTTT